MKKLKLIATALSVGACASTAPLMLLTSCGKDNYSSATLVIKESTLKHFKAICSLHFATWDEYELFNYVKTTMDGFNNGVKLAGYDRYSMIPEVQTIRAQEALWYKDPNAQNQLLLHDGAKKDEASSKITWNPNNSYGNIWYDIPATKGRENEPTIMFQAHMDADMAFSKDSMSEYNWHMNGVKYVEESEFGLISSDGATSLGADNSIGIAQLIGIAEHHDLFPHGPMRLMFSADENGATENFQAGIDFLRMSQNDEEWEAYKDKYHIDDKNYSYTYDPNLGHLRPFTDANGQPITNIASLGGLDQKKVYTSSAGIHECILNKDSIEAGEYSEANPNATPVVTNIPLGDDESSHYRYQYEFKVEGLKGGSTGVDIGKGYGSAIELLSIITQTSESDLILNSFLPGQDSTSAYQIPRSASAIITFPTQYKDPIHPKPDEEYTKDELDQMIQAKATAWANAYKIIYPKETDVKVTARRIDNTQERLYYGLNPVASMKFLELVYHCPYGPQTWFDTGEVESSLNVGPIRFERITTKTSTKYRINFHIVCRSADLIIMEYAKSLTHRAAIDLAQQLVTDGESADELLTHVDDDIWAKEENNPLLDLTDKAYKFFLYKVSHIDRHSWVSVASLIKIFENSEWLGNKTPHLVEYGAQIYDPHSVKESLDTDSINSSLRVSLYIADHFHETVK